MEATPALALSPSELDALEAEAQATAPATTGADVHAQLQSLLCSIAGFEWRRQRDLPPILCKPILRPSPPVFLLQSQLNHMLQQPTRQAQAPASQQQHVLSCVRSLMQLLQGAKETYLSLVVSRFHSRQHFVDLVALVRVGRAHRLAWGQRVTAAAAAGEATAEAQDQPVVQLLQQVDLVLLELTMAVVLTHPTLLPLTSLAPLLRGWEARWKESAAGIADTASVSSPLSHHAEWTPLLQRHVPSLWDMEPADAPTADPAPATSGLANFFRLPAPQKISDDAAAPATRDGNHWPTQDFPLPSCDPLSLLSSSSPAVIVLPRARLLRLVFLCHHFRENDFPALEEQEELQAKECRELLLRIRREQEHSTVMR